MSPSIETETSNEFAVDVLRNLLAHITEENTEGTGIFGIFSVSHAWTNGPTMYLVYQAPPSPITWGLVRDTRESIIGPAPWPSLKEAVYYYYALDLCENVCPPRSPMRVKIPKSFCGTVIRCTPRIPAKGFPDVQAISPTSTDTSIRLDRYRDYLVDGATGGTDGMGRTRTSKLIAAKRLRLIPIWDSIVERATGLDTADYWRQFHWVLTADDHTQRSRYALIIDVSG